ncbi:hypothetical protein [Pirellula sp. SH-Sr6A]|uniref:hypothetical protein n=1 Tax=Pirellula sp. SH-Sr6A TaxID=1632865 RepID=UPI0011BABB72|nr:hypothetical protein [Pirellula sp. SH-Sr6A]
MKKEESAADRLATMGGANQPRSNQPKSIACDQGTESGAKPLSLEALGYSIGKDCSKEPNAYLEASDAGVSGE